MCTGEASAAARRAAPRRYAAGRAAAAALRAAPPDVRAHAGPGMARHAPHHRRSTGDMTETPADEDRTPEQNEDPVAEPPAAESPSKEEPSPEQPAADAV